MENRVLRHINLYVGEVNQLLAEMSMDPKYKYANLGQDVTLTVKEESSTWDSLTYAVIENEQAVGIFKGYFSRPSGNIRALWTQAKAKNPFTIFKAIDEFFELAFIVYGCRKIKWTVAIGNKAEKMYDAYIKRKKIGRVVGILKEDDLTQDGEWVDIKAYEVLRTEYMQEIGGKKR